MNTRAINNQAVLNMFNKNIKTGVLVLTFSRRDIIEGYMLGMLPFDRIVSKLDLHSGYSGVKIEISKKDGMYTFARETRVTYIK